MHLSDTRSRDILLGNFVLTSDGFQIESHECVYRNKTANISWLVHLLASHLYYFISIVINHGPSNDSSFEITTETICCILVRWVKDIKMNVAILGFVRYFWHCVCSEFGAAVSLPCECLSPLGITCVKFSWVWQQTLLYTVQCSGIYSIPGHIYPSVGTAQELEFRHYAET